jgi:hypothetical protein
LKGKYDKPVLINHKLTPLFLNKNGSVWKSLCIVSISPNQNAGNTTINKEGSDTLWKLDITKKVWIEENKLKLKEKELEILRLYAQ